MTKKLSPVILMLLTLLYAAPALAAEGGGNLRLIGAGLIGMTMGCGGVAAVVLVQESATTQKTKRYIELAVAGIALIAGLVLLMR